ncbi:AAA ATPase domain-containing protein [Limimonas halophila]|uniref:AAA ATPase domain-containing protein n=1 Tax=Limimonas halophila TaxID=1082479 RepID=A0A1G7U6A5_9PROT|nr:AAA family ATPase [Limimonas halophila]SDG43185.1 AAA ATPase domain-containing protein [Limimonas halophila]
MKLQQIAIENYRSFAQGHVADLDAVNVLAGPNAAGKSNLFAAIEGFFGFFASTNIAYRADAFAGQLDFHNAATATPITITCTLDLGADTANVLARLCRTAPHLAQYVETKVDTARLTVGLTTKTTETGEPFTYVARVELETDRPYTLLHVPAATADALYARTQEIAGISGEQRKLRRFLKRFDSDDWDMIKEAVKPEYAGRVRMSTHRIIGRLLGAGSAELTERLEQLVRDSDDFDTFVHAVQGIIDDLEGEKSNLAFRDIEGEVTSFAGPESVIPAFYNEIARTLGGVTVTHLRADRPGIGQQDADKLLQLKMQKDDAGHFRRLQRTARDVLGVELDAFAAADADTRTAVDRVPARLDVDDIPVAAAGEGVHQGLRVVLDSDLSRPDILLVETPERGLSPAVARRVAGFLAAQGEHAQVFATTQAPGVIDAAAPRHVHAVSKPAGTAPAGTAPSGTAPSGTAVETVDTRTASERLRADDPAVRGG